MLRKIIVGFDDSDESRDALAFGKLLAETTGGHLIIIGVVPSLPLDIFQLGCDGGFASTEGKTGLASRDAARSRPRAVRNASSSLRVTMQAFKASAAELGRLRRSGPRRPALADFGSVPG